MLIMTIQSDHVMEHDPQELFEQLQDVTAEEFLRAVQEVDALYDLYQRNPEFHRAVEYVQAGTMTATGALLLSCVELLVRRKTNDVDEMREDTEIMLDAAESPGSVALAEDLLDALDEIERLREEYDDLQRRYSEEVQNRFTAEHLEDTDE